MYPKKNKYLQIINYLKEYSKLRERTVYDIERSQKYQAIIWNQDIPLDDDINFLFNSPPEENNSTILSIRRPIEPSPPIFPEPSETLKPWINKETLKDYENNPILLTPSQNEHIKLNAASDYGKIEKQFSDYLATEWLNWSKKYKLFLPEFQKYEQKKKVYFKLFEAFNKIRSFPESLELILGIGLFKYLSGENLAINRHILNFKLDIEFMDSGLINLFLKGDEISLSIETEMLSPLVNENLFIPRATNHLKEKVLEKELFEAIKIYDLKKALSGFVNSLSPDAKFQDQNDKPFNYYQKPIISFSPAIILRRKSQKGYVHVYENIFQEIESEENPNIPLFDSFIGDLGSHSSIESDYVPRDIKIRGDSNSRAILFPKKYNKEQVKIIKQSRKKNRVLVQGPPGTGKSHTIANLICNILSEGKNILVTAQTNRALEVLINHIPESFHQLVVFLLEVGNRGETTLGKSIKGLQDSLNDASLVQLEKQINNSHEKLDSLKRRKAELNNRLLDVIESDSRNVFIKNYGNASLIKHAKKIKADSYKNEWVLDEIKDLEGAETLIPQLIKLATEIKNISKIEYSPFDYWVPKNEDLISLDNYKLFRSKLKEYHSEFKEIKRSKVTKIPFHTIKTFQKLITNLNKRFELFELDDFYSNSYKQLALNKTKWNHIFSECEKLLVNKNREFLNKKKDNVCFYPKNKSKKQILADTKVIYEFVSQGNKLTGFLKPYTLPKQIKDRKYVFHDISLNSHPVTTLSRLNWLIDDLEIQILLVDIGQLLNIPITRIDINEFLDIQDRFTHLKELNRISIDNEILTTELSEIFNKPKTYFDNHIEVRKLSKFINASQLAHQIIPLEKAFRESLDYLESSSFEIHPLLSKMKDNFKKLDVNFYENQLAAIDELEKQKLIYLKKKEYKNQLIDFFPHLINQMEDIEFVQNVNEDILLEGFRWKNADQILKSYLGESTININKEIKGIENEILEKSESLLLNQAILKFIQKIPSRDSLISLLQKWQKAIEQGKRSGKRAQRYKRDAKLILSQIKDQIPCWVIPMHSLTETLAPKPELFDYIIVDEASQIGAEGIFLNYITKNIIIVGDDKQTSPQTVGVKVDEINQLIDIHLTEFPSKNFFGTENSFFDHAKMTSGVSIVLTEHFRCMPEIIEFCNQEFYAPEGINLIPLRPFSTNRLAPLKCKFVQTGYAENHNNIPEAEALVEEMKKCIENPLYKGKTMGVITLLGNRQASRIEKLIEQKIDTKEILERKIICGKASNFQGDERDIVFLSLVSAPNEKGTAIISNKNRKQEYNVAVSRAKDQLWLFHSIKTSDFGHGDLRSRLVQHFYTERKLEEGFEFIEPTYLRNQENFPSPFDSWFEVDVYLRLKKKGLTVFPQYKVGRYSIDLVIILNNGGKIAIECDGDKYHSGDQLQNDIQRQRLLERVGWEFFRIRGSQFYYNPDESLSDLWTLIEQRESVELSQYSKSNFDTLKKNAANESKKEYIPSETLNIELEEVEELSIINDSKENKPNSNGIRLSEGKGKFDLLIFTDLGNVYKLYNRERFEFQTKSLPSLNIFRQKDEKPICQVYTQNYNGFMLFGFENGKVAKINLSSYQTKQKRSCLVNGFNTEQRLLFIKSILRDKEILVQSIKNKILIFSTSLILPKGSKSSQGSQVLRSTDRVKRYLELDKIVITDKQYYYRESIPSAGFYLRDEDRISERHKLI